MWLQFRAMVAGHSIWHHVVSRPQLIHLGPSGRYRQGLTQAIASDLINRNFDGAPVGCN
jgi:hypothetical protein